MTDNHDNTGGDNTGDASDAIVITPIAIGHYADKHLASLEQGDRNVYTEVAALAALLTEFGATTVTAWDVEMPDRGGDAVDGRLAQWVESPHQRSVLYWVGHARRDGEQPVLLHAKNDERAIRPGVDAARLARFIDIRNRLLPEDHWDVVIVDTCWSGEFIRRLNAALDQQTTLRPPRVLLIGTSGDGQTTLGQFTDALADVLRQTFGAVHEIPLGKLADELRRALVGSEIVLKNITHAALRRTGVVAGVPVHVADEIRSAIAGLNPDEQRHFIPKAQGGEFGELAWYFTGRVTETAAIIDWLTNRDTGVLAVTGPAGAGKSALLGNLVIDTLPGVREVLREHHFLDTAPMNSRLPDNVFTVVVHLTGMSIQETVSRINHDLGLTSSPADPLATQLDTLVDALTCLASREPQVMLFDALDEAVDSLTIASTLLCKLGAIPGIRLVVGTRRDTREGPDQPTTDTSNLLDALNTTDRDIITIGHDRRAIGDYLASRLHAAVKCGQLPDDGRGITSVALAIGSADHQFLFAYLAVHEILATKRFPTTTELDDLVSTDHRGLFRRALDRITRANPHNHHLIRVLAHSQGRGIPLQDATLTRIVATLAGVELTDRDIHALLDLAAPYILIDTEHGQTVYRVAHRTFAEHFTTNHTDASEVHHAVLTTAIHNFTLGPHQPVNPYFAHHLSTHAAQLHQTGWNQLGDHPDLLDRLDPASVAADAMRTALGHHSLPPAIAGIIGARHHLIHAELTDRPGLRQFAISRHTAITTHPQPALPHAWHLRWADITPNPLHHTLGHTSMVTAVATLSLPDGRTVLASGTFDGSVRLWDPISGMPVGEPFIGNTVHVTAMAAVPLPDGRTLLATGSDDGTVRFWDPTIGALVGESLTCHTGRVTAMAAVSLPDGRTCLATGSTDELVTTSKDETVRLWDPTTGNQVCDPLTGHTGGVTAIAAVPSSEGRTVLATSHQETVRLWDPATGLQEGEPLTDGDWVHSVTAVPMPDGRTLLATSTGWEVRLWDPDTRTVVSELNTYDFCVVSVMVAVPMPDGRTLLAASDKETGAVWLWDAATSTPIGHPLTGHDGNVTGVAVVRLPDGRTLLATSSLDETARLWDLTTTTPVDDPSSGYAIGVSAMAVVPMPDGRSVLAESSVDDTKVRLWDAVSGSQVCDLLTGGHRVDGLAAVPMPDGRTLLAVNCYGVPLQLWDPDTATPAGDSFPGHTIEVSVMAVMSLSNGRALIATGSYDGVVRLWDPATRVQVGDPIAAHSAMMFEMASVPLPDGRTLLATSSLDEPVRLWDLATGVQVCESLTGRTHDGLALATVPMPDGRILLAISSYDDVTVRLCDAITGDRIGQLLTGHTDSVRAVAAVPLPDGQTLLATGSSDGTVRLWDVSTRRLVERLYIGREVTAMTPIGFSALAVALSDGIAVVAPDSLNSRSQPVPRTPGS